MDDPATSQETKQALREEYESLNPALLKRQMDSKLQELAQVYQAKQGDATVKEKAVSVTFLREAMTTSSIISVT